MTTDMASNVKTSENKDFLSESLYNNPHFSDVVLVFNNEKYHLLSIVLAKYAPLLWTEFENVTITAKDMESSPSLSSSSSSSSSNSPSADQLLASLTALLGQKYQKKTVIITDSLVSNQVVKLVLKSLYGEPFEITQENLADTLIISGRFGIEQLSQECVNIYHKTMNYTTLLRDYQKIVKDNSPLESLFKEFLFKGITQVPYDDLVKFIKGCERELIIELLTYSELHCTEDFVWNLIKDRSDLLDLIPYITLENLSIDILTKEVKRFVAQEDYVYALEKRVDKSNDAKDSCYRNEHVFCIGNLKRRYLGYRLATAEEVDTKKFSELFNESYKKYNGIWSLINLDGSGQVELCCDSAPIITNGCRIRINCNLPKQNRYVKLLTHTGEISSNRQIKSAVHYELSSQSVGLFVLVNVSFEK